MKGASKVQFENMEKVELALNSIVCLSGKLQYHPEFDGRYTICTDNKNTKLVVNSEIYKMLSYIEKRGKVVLITLAGAKNVFYSQKFQDIIKMLITKKYLTKIA
jgi:hypothetical protein